MEDLMYLNKLKDSRYQDSGKDKELFTKFKEFMSRESMHRDSSYLEEPYYEDRKKEHSARSIYKNAKSEDHFSIHEAEDIVANMFHYDGGRKYVGEKYSMMKAKEVCERYRGMIPTHINYVDVYVAINAQYHDYSILFKSWFGDNIDSKIIESAVIFWFRDDDFSEENKLKAYFNM